MHLERRWKEVRLHLGAVAVAAGLLLSGAPAQAAAPFGEAARTPLFLTLTGHLRIDGVPASAGAAVAVYDPAGVLCGSAAADPSNGGAFVLHVYGDDPTTGAPEGPLAGEALRFAVYDPWGRTVFEGAAVRIANSAVGLPPPSLPLVFLDRGAFTLDLEVSRGSADADADGVPDASDAFPADPAASVDTDADGSPDAWNPGKSQGDSTTGLALDEFPLDPTRWFDPSRHRPAAPGVPSLAADPAAPLSLFSATLSPFVDPDGDAMAALEWRIVERAPLTGALVANAFEARLPASNPPTFLRVPDAVLGAERLYGFTVRYQDAGGLWSEFSTEASLETSADPRDLGGQPGIQDDAEAPQTEPGTVRFVDPATSAPLGLRVPAGLRAERLYVTDAADIPPESRPPGEVRYGLYSICLGGVEVGASVEVTFAFPTGLPGDARWYNIGADGVPEDYTARCTRSGDGKAVAVALTDGGAGDADGVANGVIVESGGPVVPGGTAPASGGGGGGGCFLDATAAAGSLRAQGLTICLLVFAAMAARMAGRARRAAPAPASIRRRFWEKSS